MSVDVSSPVPDELDARVEQMLAHMDRVHAEVVNRLGGEADDIVPPPTRASPPVSPEPPVSPVPPEPPPASGLDAEVEKALSNAAAAKSDSSSKGVDVPTATIKELDDQLASAVRVDSSIDDDFADGTQMVEGQSLDVPLPDSSPLGELPPLGAPPEVVVAAAAQLVPVVAEAPRPVAPTPAPAPVAVVAPAVRPAPAPKPVAAPAAAPVKPVAPAVIAAPKPTGPTLADRFWRIATPVMEPIAVRLGKLPVGFQHTVGWIGIVTLFMAGATWGYVFFFQETRVGSHIAEAEAKEHAGAEPIAESKSVPSGGDAGGHGAPKPTAPRASGSHAEPKATEGRANATEAPHSAGQ